MDNLRDVQELANELRPIFEGYTIYQSTGYVSKSENHNKKIKAANLIIATNKAEVGVNYNVEYCIMQPGRYFQNFVQRFGRVSRGNLDGKVVIGIDKKFGKIKRSFKGKVHLDYYDFIELMRLQLQGKSFYEKRVPFYVGEYLWCISNRIRRHQEFDVSRYLQRRLKETNFFKSREAQRFLLFKKIHDKICKMMAIALKQKEVSQTYWDNEIKKLELRNKKRTLEWATWWKNYIDTYLTFRDGSKVVKVYDRILNEELDYSLDWILQHKVIENIKVIQTEPFEIIKYTVGNLKERDKDIQYTVSTIPNAGMMRNNLLSYNDMHELDKIFERSVERIYDKVKKGDEEIHEFQMALCNDIIHLALTFNKKRLKIESIDNNDNFL